MGNRKPLIALFDNSVVGYFSHYMHNAVTYKDAGRYHGVFLTVQRVMIPRMVRILGRIDTSFTHSIAHHTTGGASKFAADR